MVSKFDWFLVWRKGFGVADGSIGGNIAAKGKATGAIGVRLKQLSRIVEVISRLAMQRSVYA